MHIVINSRQPTYTEVLGLNADLRSREDREEGRNLNSTETKTSENTLWDAADSAKHQWKNAQRGYSTHQDRRGDHHCKNRGSLTEQIVNRLPFEDGRSKRQYRGKERLCTIVDEDRFSLNGVPVKYELSGIAGPSRSLVVNEEEYCMRTRMGLTMKKWERRKFLLARR